MSLVLASLAMAFTLGVAVAVLFFLKIQLYTSYYQSVFLKSKPRTITCHYKSDKFNVFFVLFYFNYINTLCHLLNLTFFYVEKPSVLFFLDVFLILIKCKSSCILYASFLMAFSSLKTFYSRERICLCYRCYYFF